MRLFLLFILCISLLAVCLQPAVGQAQNRTPVSVAPRMSNAQRLAILCARADGVSGPSGCRCPLSSRYQGREVIIDPSMMNCSAEEKCKAGYGQPSFAGCVCALDSRKAGSQVTIDSRNITFDKQAQPVGATCTEDRACVISSYGTPTSEGCSCRTTGHMLDVANNVRCDLKLQVNGATCTRQSETRALADVQAELSKLFQRLANAQTHGCDLSQAEAFPPEQIGTVAYFAANRTLPKNWPGFFNLLMRNPNFRDSIPNLNLIKEWQDRHVSTSDDSTISQIRPVPYRCPGGNGILYPAYPEQTSKIYNHYLFGIYDHNRIMTMRNSADLDACRLGMTAGSRACLQTTEFALIMASDTFVDSCGNLYRGFWHHGFLRKNEVQPDLFSRGRSQFVDELVPSQQGSYQTVTGHTYGVPVEDLFLLSEPFPGDQERSMRQRARALNSGEFELNCGAFQPVGIGSR